MALDQATAGFLAQLAESRVKPLPEMTPEEARGFTAGLRDLIGPGPDVARSYDEQVPTPDGPPMTVRVLTPEGQVRAIVVYYHGGGWVIGAIEEFDTLGRILANTLRAAVVLIDYRLAPEHPYPAAANDAWTGLLWAHEHAAAIAGRTVPLIVMGDSAGGNLSAVVAQRATAEGGPQLTAQVLIYPVTDADTGNGTYADPENQLMLTRESMIWFWDHYAPDLADRANPDASPLRAADLAGLPPAIVLTAEYDVLREEGEVYAIKLRDAGVEVEHKRFLGQMHGFFTMVNLLPGSADAIAYVAEQLDGRLGG